MYNVPANGQNFKRRPSTQATSPFRYPGGKGFLTDLLRQKVRSLPGENSVYAEPFCGGAGAAINLLVDNEVDRIILNDLDANIYSAWKAMVFENERFLARLSDIPITTAEWKKQKSLVEAHQSGYSFDIGFATFYINRTSRAGIVLGSGPIGGYEQKGNWKIDARFYRDTMLKRIKKIGALSKRIEVRNTSAIQFLQELNQRDDAASTFAFIDPPYFEVGSRLYFDGMGEFGHSELSRLMSSEIKFQWLMTYDNHPEIRKLYRDFEVTELDVIYSLQKSRIEKEVVIQAAR